MTERELGSVKQTFDVETASGNGTDESGSVVAALENESLATGSKAAALPPTPPINGNGDSDAAPTLKDLPPPHKEEAFDLKAPPCDDVLILDAPTGDHAVGLDASSESIDASLSTAPPNEEITSKAPPADEAITSKAPPADEAITSKAPAVDDAIKSKAPPAEESVVPKASSAEAAETSKAPTDSFKESVTPAATSCDAKNGGNAQQAAPPVDAASNATPGAVSPLKKAMTCPTSLSTAATAASASSTAAGSQRAVGPPPVKVRRKEPQKSATSATSSDSTSADQSMAAAPLPPRNYSFLAGELDYFIVCGLPLSAADASLKRTFRGLYKKSLCEASQVVVVPEIDSKTVLLFSGGVSSSANTAASGRVPKQLTLKRLQKKLQSGLFVSRFPEDANLKNLRAFSSDSQEYLYKWTRLYFCPVSFQVAEEIQCQHFLVSNLSPSLLRSPSDLLIKFSQTMPTARSFFLPVDEGESPLGYMLVRFNKSEDCLACYRLLQKHYSMEMTFVSLLEVCQLPGGFRVPAHNLLNWCRLERPNAAPAGFAAPPQPRVVLDDPVRSPYLCTCHPDAQGVAPPPERLHQVADELEDQVAKGGVVDFKSLLLRLC